MKIGHAATVTTLTNDKEMMRDHLHNEKENMRNSLTEELRRNTERLNAENATQLNSHTTLLRETHESWTLKHNTMESELRAMHAHTTLTLNTENERIRREHQ